VGVQLLYQYEKAFNWFALEFFKNIVGLIQQVEGIFCCNNATELFHKKKDVNWKRRNIRNKIFFQLDF
jgi:hypothetical protein